MDSVNGAGDPVPVSDDEDGSCVSTSPISHEIYGHANDKNSTNGNEIVENAACNASNSTKSNGKRQIDNVSLENGDNEEKEIQGVVDYLNVNEDISDAGDEDQPNHGVDLSPLFEDTSDRKNDIENVSASPSTSPKECLDEIIIGKEMNDYIELNRINWAELEEVNDLWAICDAVSAAHSGLPDSLLKESFLIVLEGHLSKNRNAWMHQHLEFLLRLWKKEVQSQKFVERPTRFIASSVEYTVPLVVKKKRRTNAEKKKAQLIRLMSVGEALEKARVKFATEEGEFDVEEDEHGNYTIDGQELTFEAWGEINRIEQADIVHCPIAPPKQKRPHAKVGARRRSQLNNAFKPICKLASMPLAHIQTVMPATKSLAHTSGEEINKKEPKIEENKSKPEKDEGELSESDDDDEHSDSSSSSDDLQSASAVARHRRKRRREQERQKGQASVSNVSSMFQKFYQYRFQIAQLLTIQQKASFMDLIKQNNGGMSEARQQQITQFMVNFMGGGY